MTDAELQALIEEFRVQTEDLVQAVVKRMLGINEGEVSLTQGTTTIVFANSYDVGEDWHFLKRVAISSDGFDIGVEITNETKDGFEVTVSEACTFKYRTEMIRSWITD